MKLEALFEMPISVNREMPIFLDSTIRFYSEDTISREFDIISKIKSGAETLWSILKKDKTKAIIGSIGIRKEDGKPGLKMLGELEFKKPDLAFDKDIKTPGHVLQVDSVIVYDTKFNGIGYNLYLSIVEAGYILVSDHTQFVGGRKLWEKLAKFTSSNKYAVYVLDNGSPVLDDQGEPLAYNGSNLSDEKIWKPETTLRQDSTRYVLLMLKKK
jgi:hypothetical protein